MNTARRSRIILLWLFLFLLPLGAAPPSGPKSPVLTAMEQELERTGRELKSESDAPLHFLSYTITETKAEVMAAAHGTLTQEDQRHDRVLDVTARVGTPELDSTHEIRGEGFGGGFGGATAIPLDDDPAVIRNAIWLATDARIKAARERFIRVQTNRAVKVEEEHPAPDFSKETPQVRIDALPTLTWDRSAWRSRLRELSRRIERYPFVLDGDVTLSVSNVHTFLANSEGTRLQLGRTHVRIFVALNGKAEDGMDLRRGESFDAANFSGLPKDEVLIATIDRLAKELQALREAPLAEPFTGPAILRNRASGVFFHEIFGHRIEGHRQKLSDEGQTFAKKIGQPILPPFLSVIDDPSMPKLGNLDLNGHYPFDDEGVPSRRVTLVDKGVLKEFLLSRSPLSGFPNSNGHGRRQPGRDPVSRQGNLMVVSTKQVPFAQLRRMLIEECKKQNKPYGLIFDDISGGYTTTSRSGPQAFKVLPLLVTRVFADGRPDQVVRGADLVGTPLVSFSKILATGDDTAVFNGYCGAESGFVPVSAISPSILVSELEVEKRQTSPDRPPLLPAPGSESPGELARANGGSSSQGTHARHRSEGVGGPVSGRAGGGVTPAANVGAAPASLPADDPAFRAMADEMARSRAQLKMDTFAPPYFMAYTAHETETVSIAATMGALLGSSRDRGRRLYADVRVGDATLDSSNFAGRGRVFGGVNLLPAESRYETDRRALWLATDEAYKQAIETLANKKAALQRQAAQTRPPDLAMAEPFTYAGATPALDVDTAAWEKTARAVSAAFRRFPAIQNGQASLRAEGQTQRFLNSEGSWHRTGTTLFEVTLRATVRTDQGETISDVRHFYARRAAELPPQEKLIAAAESLATSLTELASAKKGEEYSGPVLFTGEAAATFFDRLLAEKLTNPAPPVTEDGRIPQFQRGDKLTGQLGRKILPTGFRVVDDPTVEALDGTPLLGAYRVDDDGVPAAKLSLVEDGILKAYYMSRVPTQEIATSNGHGRRAGGGRPTGQPGNLIVTVADGHADMVERLKALCKEENLPYGLVVDRFEADGRGGGPRFGGRFGGGRGRGGPRGQAAQPTESSELPDTLMFRKVYTDGREEIVRGGRLVGAVTRTLRNIAAAGSDRNVVTRRLAGSASAVTIVAPSVLVTGLDVRPDEPTPEKPPLIPPPAMAVR
jgi:predicted Zn-dependent protease